MRKKLLALGLILLFVGVIFTSSALQSDETVKEREDLVKSETFSWQISSHFTQGDKVRLSVAPGQDWRSFKEPPVEDVPFPHKFVFINITDPNGKDSFFEVVYAEYEGYFSLYDVRLVAGNGFDAQNSSSGIVGYARDTGIYNATVWGTLPPGGGPPTLTFSKMEELLIVTYPYSFLLYPGVVVLVVGAILSVLGARSPRHARHA